MITRVTCELVSEMSAQIAIGIRIDCEMKTPREIYARIAQMGWDERRTRIVQETAKRVDLALYRLGRLPNQDDLDGFTFGGKFFFSTVELPLLRSFL